MSLPNAPALFDTLAATWPAQSSVQNGPFTLRDGAGGGKRASAATLEGEFDADALEAAIAAMDTPLFMIRPGQEALDQALAVRGFEIVDPTTIYAAPVDSLAARPEPVSAFTIWPPLAIMSDLWDQGGIGPARRAVMARVAGPKAGLLGRREDSPAGAGFIAIHDKIAMVHALEVTPALRRKGAALNMMRAGAMWAQDNGGATLALAVTRANHAANALYLSLGMREVARYHYRAQKA